MLGLAKFNLWMLNLCQVTSACTIPTTFHFNLENFSCALKPQCLRASASVPPPLRRYHLLMHWRCCLSPFCKFFFFFFIYFLFFTEQNATTPVPPRPLHRARHINHSWSHYPCHLLAASTHSTSPFISFFSFIYLLSLLTAFALFFWTPLRACLSLLCRHLHFLMPPGFSTSPPPFPQRPLSWLLNDPWLLNAPAPISEAIPALASHLVPSMTPPLAPQCVPGSSTPRPLVPQCPVPQSLNAPSPASSTFTIVTPKIVYRESSG